MESTCSGYHGTIHGWQEHETWLYCSKAKSWFVYNHTVAGSHNHYFLEIYKQGYRIPPSSFFILKSLARASITFCLIGTGAPDKGIGVAYPRICRRQVFEVSHTLNPNSQDLKWAIVYATEHYYDNFSLNFLNVLSNFCSVQPDPSMIVQENFKCYKYPCQLKERWQNSITFEWIIGRIKHNFVTLDVDQIVHVQT